MKLLGAVAVLVLGLGITGLYSPRASAETLSRDQKIEVHAEVLPFRFITIDSDGKIIQVGGNTDQDVPPQVFLNSPTSGNERPLTADIYAHYRQLVPAGKSRIGILYDRRAIKPAPKNDRLVLTLAM